jgi:hypothetical protein
LLFCPATNNFACLAETVQKAGKPHNQKNTN